MLPVIAKVSQSMQFALPKLGYAELTNDDKFLIQLNSVFSNRASVTGLNNHARGYTFDQRVPFETLPAPVLLTDVDLQTVVEQRAAQLVAQNKPLKLFWSGGIDSTLMTAALLPVARDITVYHTCESIKENPYFIDYINQFNIKTVLWSDAWLEPFDRDDLIVTGTSADEITASLDESFWTAYHSELNSPWQDFFAKQGHGDLIARCEELFSQSPADISTVFDARWWFYFYIRHTYFARRDWDLNLNNVDNVVSFFDCAEFDSWSMRHKHTLIGNKYSDYKRPFKEATTVYWHNQDYVDNKQKTNSFMMSSWLSRRVIWNSQQYLFMYKNASGNYCRFTPSQYPYISKADIMKALNDL